MQNTLKINIANRASTILYRFLINSKIDSWILPANICFIVPLLFLKAGKKIQFIDISIDTLLIDEQIVYDTINKSKIPLGLLLNHTYGLEFNYSNFIKTIKEKHPKTSIIEDKCLCIPQIDHVLDQYIDLILYSTGYAKYCDLGFGGYGLTHFKIDNSNFEFNIDNQSPFLDSINNEIKKHQHFDFECDVKGNWLDNRDLPIDINDYFVRIEETLPLIKTHKTEINEIYYENLPVEIQLNPKFQQWRFNIMINNKDEIFKTIFKSKLFASSHYPDMSFYFERETAQNSFQIHNKIINLLMISI